MNNSKSLRNNTFQLTLTFLLILFVSITKADQFNTPADVCKELKGSYQAKDSLCTINEKLNLKKSKKDKIEGVYSYGNIGVKFILNLEHPGTKDESWLMKLHKLDGKPLVDWRLKPKKSADIIIISNNKVVLSRSLLKDKRSSQLLKGNREYINTFMMTTPEIYLLPSLSQKLGTEAGINGRDVPISMMLHRLAMGIAKINNINLDIKSTDLEIRCGALKPEGKINPESNSVKVPKIFGSNCDARNDECAPSDCLGMCGNDCSCWWWVCFDCCCNMGCLGHDRDCVRCENGQGCYDCYFGSLPSVNWVSCSRCYYHCDNTGQPVAVDSSPTYTGPSTCPGCPYVKGFICCVNEGCVPANRGCRSDLEY